MTVLVCAGAPSAMAQGWAVEASIETGAEFDDNPLLRPSGGEATFTASASPDVKIKRAFQTSEFNLGLGLTAEKVYGDGVEGSGGQDLDTVNYHATAGFKSAGRRVDFGLGASFQDSSARTSELIDTGILDAEARRRSVSTNGNLSYTLTERNFLDVKANASDVTYDSGPFTDFRSYGGDLGFRRSVSAADDAGVSFGYSRYDPRGGTGSEESDRYSLSLTWSHKPSEAFSFDASAGVRTVVSRPAAGSGGDETNTGATFSLGLTWNPSRRETLSVTAANGIEPSGGGAVQNRWSLNASYGLDLTSDIRFGLPVSFLYQEPVSDPAVEDRIYFDLGPNLVWTFLPSWRVSATYRFRAQDNAGGGSFARSNAVFLRLSYQTSVL